MIQDYYNEVAGRKITSGLILSHQTANDFSRFHPHWHGILIEGGFDDEGNFVYLPISSTKQMTELFRQRVIKYFEENKLINSDFTRNLLSWKNLGFSIDNLVKIFGSDEKARESNDYFKENFRVFDAPSFIALVTAHIHPY